MIDEAYVSTALHDLVDHDTVADPPTQHLLRRARRRRRLRAGAIASAATVVAAVTVAGVAVTPTGAERGLAEAPLSQPISYRFKMTLATNPVVAGNGPDFVMVYNGAYDPVHRRGSMASDFQDLREIAIGDVCYSRDQYRSRWNRTAEPCNWAAGGDRLPAWLSPAAVFDQLNQRGTVEYVGRTGNGSTEVDVWRFSYVWPTDSQAPVEDQTVSGTIEVNAFSGRVSKVVSHIPSAAASVNVSTNQRINLYSMDQTVEFSDYGKPVAVSEPSDFVNVEPSPR